ncbi:MAG: hydratase [Alsobacter sp.]
MAVPSETLQAIAEEVIATRGAGVQILPFTARHPSFDLADAYRVVEATRRRREDAGERIVGRKIGFTNRAAWEGYGIAGPIWNYLYDRTTSDLGRDDSVPVGGWMNLRMETEVALGLCAAPSPDMDERQLIECVAWAALDFEICSSVFPDWRFDVADAAATGVHVALLIGPRQPVADDRQGWLQRLSRFTATLACDDGISAQGGGAQVLGSPLAALAALLGELERYGGEAPRAGDIVTTGTLTTALPARPGQVWRAEARGIALGGISVRLA